MQKGKVRLAGRSLVKTGLPALRKTEPAMIVHGVAREPLY